jgi:hypothetical protein
MIYLGLGTLVLSFGYFWNAPAEDEQNNPFWKATQWIKKKVGK